MIKQIKKAAQKTDNLPIPKKGSSYRKIYDANELLINGTESISSNVSQLAGVPQLAGVSQLAGSLKVISDGQTELGTAIKLLAQKDELTSAFKVIIKEKNKQLSQAFDNVFIIGGGIVFICTPLALLTEKRKLSKL